MSNDDEEAGDCSGWDVENWHHGDMAYTDKFDGDMDEDEDDCDMDDWSRVTITEYWLEGETTKLVGKVVKDKVDKPN